MPNLDQEPCDTVAAPSNASAEALYPQHRFSDPELDQWTYSDVYVDHWPSVRRTEEPSTAEVLEDFDRPAGQVTAEERR